MQLAYKRVIARSDLQPLVDSFDRTYRSVGRPAEMALWVLAGDGDDRVQVACRVPDALDIHWQFQNGWTLGPVIGEGWVCRVGDGACAALTSVDSFDLVR